MKESAGQKYPNGTTKEQWDAYGKALDAHKKYMESFRPNMENFCSEANYDRAMDEWWRKFMADAPKVEEQGKEAEPNNHVKPRLVYR